MTPENIIKKLNLTPHPEGGYFIEIKKSEEFIESMALPSRYKNKRSFYTSIYFLLNKEQVSHFHKVNSDETWYFHYGSSVKIHLLSPAKGYSYIVLGSNILADEVFQYTVDRGTWFAAELIDKTSFGLFSCAVAPGFEYDDFELAKEETLVESFPEQKELIKSLTLS